MRLAPLLLLLLLPLAVRAAEPATPAPPPPPMPDKAPPPADKKSGDQDQMQPEVTIRHEGKATVQEYRINGRLYKVKITPAKGAPYYLVDTNGDGSLDTYEGGLENPPTPRWILFQW